MYTMVDTTFNDWLINEINAKGWSQSELARKAGITRAAISLILSQSRKPGTDLCTAIAGALNYPPEFVFRMAGILPPSPEQTEQIEQLTYLFNKFSEVEKKDLLNYMRIKLMMKENDIRASSK